MYYETKRKPRLFVLSLLFISARLVACDLCGCYIGVLPYDNQSSIGLLHRYRVFSGCTGSTGAVFPSGAYRLPPPSGGSVLHGTMQGGTVSSNNFESFKVFELRGKWFIHPRIELNAIVPVADNRAEYNGVKFRTTGLGDVTVFAGYHLLKKTGDGNFRHRLVAGAGIKLPSGNCSAAANGERLSLTQQAGTGSVDALLYTAYTGGGFNFRWGITAALKLSGTNRYGEQLRPAETSTAFAGYLVKAGKWNFLPQLQTYQERVDGVWISNRLEEGTRMRCLLGGPAVSVYRGRLIADVGMQFPLYDKPVAGELLNKARMFVGLSLGFNQGKFLFPRTKKSVSLN